MRRRYCSILLEALLWVMAEIILQSAEVDTLADYSEFLVNQLLNHSVMIVNIREA